MAKVLHGTDVSKTLEIFERDLWKLTSSVQMEFSLILAGVIPVGLYLIIPR